HAFDEPRADSHRCSREVRELDPARRPGAAELLQNPFRHLAPGVERVAPRLDHVVVLGRLRLVRLFEQGLQSVDHIQLLTVDSLCCSASSADPLSLSVLTPCPPLPSGEGRRCTDAVPPLLQGEGVRGSGPERRRRGGTIGPKQRSRVHHARTSRPPAAGGLLRKTRTPPSARGAGGASVPSRSRKRGPYATSPPGTPVSASLTETGQPTGRPKLPLEDPKLLEL